MKYIKIELIAEVKYKKGTRLVVSLKDGKYLSTVTKTIKNKVYVVLDNGEKTSLPQGSKKILGLGKKAKRKKALPEKNLNKYFAKDTVYQKK